MIVPRRVVGDPVGQASGSSPSETDGTEVETPDSDVVSELEGFDPDQPLLEAITLVTEGGSRVSAVSTDPHLQLHQGRSGDPRLDAQHLLIDLAMLSAVGPGADERDTPGIVAVDLTPDPAEPADAAFLFTLVAGIERSPFIDAIDLDQAIGRPSALTRHRIAATDSTTDLSSLRRDLDLARLSIGSFHAVFPPVAPPVDPPPADGPDAEAPDPDAGDPDGPEPTPDQVDFDRLLAVVVSSRLQPSERSPYFVSIADVMERALDGIAVHARAITLPARDGTVPITLTNGSERPAVVTLRLDSDRLDFPLGPRIEVELPPGSTTVEVAVRARASGAFPLDIEVESPDGRIALAASRYTVRSTAVSGVGVAISVAAIAVLGVWWVRTARRARATRAGLATDAPAGDT